MGLVCNVHLEVAQGYWTRREVKTWSRPWIRRGQMGYILTD